jgi:DNA-binding beta-propeller fold protein YncE
MMKLTDDLKIIDQIGTDYKLHWPSCITVYNDYAYICQQDLKHSLRVFDLRSNQYVGISNNNRHGVVLSSSIRVPDVGVSDNNHHGVGPAVSILGNDVGVEPDSIDSRSCDVKSEKKKVLLRAPVSCAIHTKLQYLYVSDPLQHTIHICDLKNPTKPRFVRSFGCCGFKCGQFWYPYGIAIYECLGLVFVSDRNNSRIQVFDTEGVFIREFGNSSLFSYPSAICIDEIDDLFFVADAGNNQIQLFEASSGKYLTQIGSKRRSNKEKCDSECDDEDNECDDDDSDNDNEDYGSTNDGEFSCPKGICYDNKTSTLYVADSCNNRIQSFTLCCA